MHQLGLGLVVAGCLCALVAVSGYIAANSDHLIGGEPPRWMTLSREQQQAERDKAFARLRSWKPTFRNFAAAGLCLFVAGVVIAVLS